MSRDYDRWKAGKKVWKAPWIIEYWESITDKNQYSLSNKCHNREMMFMVSLFFGCGIVIGYLLGGF